MRKKNKKDIIRRLKITEGHLKKVIKMVEDDTYCINVLQQTTAVKSAIKKAEALMLEDHLNSCLVSAIRNDNKEKALEEILETFKKSS